MTNLELVQSIKADLEQRGISLSGPCGAFQITKRVAWALKDSGAGLLDKPSGNNCEGYATDVVAFPNGTLADILGDGGGANAPQWAEKPNEFDPKRWRPAIDPGDAPQPAQEPEPQPPAEASAVALLEHLAHGLNDIADQLKAINQKLDGVATKQDLIDNRQQLVDAAKGLAPILKLFGR